jgi:hypothetical protein
MKIGLKWLYAAMVLTGGFLGGIAAMEFAPGVAIATHQTRMLRAEQFELVDNSGAKRAVLSNGSQLASLTAASDNQANLTLYDPNTGRARVGLGVAANGSPALVLFDQKGNDRVELNINSKGKPGLALADENGKTIAGLPAETTAQTQQ